MQNAKSFYIDFMKINHFILLFVILEWQWLILFPSANQLPQGHLWVIFDGTASLRQC